MCYSILKLCVFSNIKFILGRFVINEQCNDYTFLKLFIFLNMTFILVVFFKDQNLHTSKSQIFISIRFRLMGQYLWPKDLLALIYKLIPSNSKSISHWTYNFSLNSGISIFISPFNLLILTIRLNYL